MRGTIVLSAFQEEVGTHRTENTSAQSVNISGIALVSYVNRSISFHYFCFEFSSSFQIKPNKITQMLLWKSLQLWGKLLQLQNNILYFPLLNLLDLQFLFSRLKHDFLFPLNSYPSLPQERPKRPIMTRKPSKTTKLLFRYFLSS